MNHTFSINSYQELEEFLNDLEFLYCKKCKDITIHLRCGFEDNNARWECLRCQ